MKIFQRSAPHICGSLIVVAILAGTLTWIYQPYRSSPDIPLGYGSRGRYHERIRFGDKDRLPDPVAMEDTYAGNDGNSRWILSNLSSSRPRPILFQSNDLAGCDGECQRLRERRRLSRVVAHPADSQEQDLPSCDKECNRFRKDLRSFPPGKTRAAIYILTRRKRLDQLRSTLEALDKHFNDEYRYPIIIFHEKELANATELMRSFTRSKVYFQMVTLEVPKHLNPKFIPEKDCLGKPLGYRHMCRFHAIGVYREAIMADPELEYAWRLDDDSEILDQIGYDVIAYMKYHRFQYSYMRILHGSNSSCCFIGFWETVDKYARANYLPRDRSNFYWNWPRPFVYFNNFEISDMSVWRSREYKKFVAHLDQRGGIYYYRWGDAEIKTAAVSLFVPAENIFRFWDISYFHVDWGQKKPKFEN